MPETTQAVIFDFDGTLADSMVEVLATYNALASKWSLPQMSAERIPELRKLTHRELLSALDIPLWKVPAMMIEVRAALRHRITALHPFPGIRELLQGLYERQIPLYVVSSNSEENIEVFRKLHDLPQFAGYRGSVGLLGKGRQLKNLLARERLDPPKTYYVGDEVRDVEAAASAGMRSIAVSWGYGDRSTLHGSRPNYLVDAPAEVAACVLGR